MLMVICQTGTSVDEVFTNWKPESTPVLPFARVMSVHGSAKVDWVTVWFLATLIPNAVHQSLS